MAGKMLVCPLLLLSRSLTPPFLYRLQAFYFNARSVRGNLCN
uniref:Uncharacterized protein n=1 Tax=Phakopsora pachyrhizi TaxID=170000 RepID=A0A0S1MJJ4_PHAPC